jgi:hypothetical protein
VKRVLTLLLSFALLLSLFAGCGKPAGEGAVPTPGAAETATPTPAPDPRADFNAGAKEFLSTDLVSLLTEEDEDGSRLIGMLSSLLYDLNNATAESGAKLTLQNVVMDGEAADESIGIEIGALHDADSGDSSLNLSLGLGTDTNKKLGVFITGDQVLVRPNSTAHSMLLYTMPDAPGASPSFLDQVSVFLTGMLSEDGVPVTLSANKSDREAVSARFLDPWLTDTDEEDYRDETVVKTLAGKEAALRAVTLDMSGSRAYDFVLGSLKRLQADAGFADMDRLLGMVVDALDRDVYDLLQTVRNEGGETETLDSAVGLLISELEELTPEEISAAVFVVSLYFKDDKPIGIDINAATTGKSFDLDFILYREGLEHELDLYYHCISGTTASLSMSTIGKGGDTYDVKGAAGVTTAAGLQTALGSYAGALAETDSSYALTGDYDFVLRFLDEDDKEKTGALGGGLSLDIQKDDAGYTGTGNLSLELLSDESSLSADMLIDASLALRDSVDISPPAYAPSAVTQVANRSDVVRALADDPAEWLDLSGFAQIVRILFALLLD